MGAEQLLWNKRGKSKRVYSKRILLTRDTSNFKSQLGLTMCTEGRQGKHYSRDFGADSSKTER